MKKLLKFMACALAVSFGLTACDNGEEPHHPFDSGYNPKGSQLNTSHSLVGEMFNSKTGAKTTDPEEAEGIVFAVSKDGKTAYLVSFTDAMVVGAYRPTDKDKYCFDSKLGYCALQIQWGLTVPSYREVYYDKEAEDSVENTKGIINNVDGEINTKQIIDLFAKAKKEDTTITLPTVYAAQICRDYYRREWSTKRDDGNGANNDQLAVKWQNTKGEWYLPSIEELGDLMKNKDKINKKYGNVPSDFIQENKYFFMRIGGEQDHAYWSSSEFNVQAAWNCLPNPIRGKGTYPGNSRYNYSQKNDRINMYVRPIRKAPIK